MSNTYIISQDMHWLEVDFSRWGKKPRDNHKFDIIKKAIIQHRCIKIKYAALSL